ncbi:MAG: hypothetical protein WHS89_06730 [Acidimicrobiales bacterium]
MEGVRAHWPALVAIAVAVAVLWPVVVSGLAGLQRRWLPAGDWAVIELRTRDVGTAATPLVGPYSRFGWNHPGPLLFWLLALPYRLAGSDSGALLLAAALVNALAVAGMLVIAWRRGRLVLVVGTAVVVALMMTHLGPSFLRDPWNPSVTVLPFGLLVMLCWSAVEGDRLGLPAAVLVGAFLVQSHVGFALVVAVLWAVATFGYLWASRAAPRRRVHVIVAAVLLFVGVWMPVVIDQVAGAGNVSALVDYFVRGSGEATAGLVRSAGVVARELGDVAPWMGGREIVVPADGSVASAPLRALVVPVLCFALAAWVAWRVRELAAVRFQAVVAATAIAGVVSVSRITGEVYNYLIRWWWVIAALWWLSTAWSLWSAGSTVLGRHPIVGRARLERASALVALVAFAVTLQLSARTVDGVDEVGTPDGEWYVQIEPVVGDLIASAPRPGPALVRFVGTRNASVADGLRLQLERAGIPVVVDDDLVFKFGESRRASTHEPQYVVWVVMGGAVSEVEAVSARDGQLQEIARWDPLTPEQRAALVAGERALAEQLRAIGRDDLATAALTGGDIRSARDLEGVDVGLWEAVTEARRRGDPIAVFLGPAGDDVPGEADDTDVRDVTDASAQ